MIEHHWDEIEAEFVWDEGGFGLRDFFGPEPVFTVAVAEKKDLWVKLIAHGEPGHSGMPHDNNAIDILTDALAKVKTINEKYEVHPVTHKMFAAIGRMKTFPTSFLLKHLNNPLVFAIVKPMLTGDSTIAAMMKDTLSITVLKAGEKENVIPDLAEATLDIRLLPDRDPETFLAGLKQLINDDRVEIQQPHTPPETRVSDMDSEFFTTLAGVIDELVPNSVTAPMMTPGTTDSCFFRRKGVNSYGLFPAVITPEEFARFHGIDERISIENLVLGTRVFYTVLKRLCE
jgi:acetylornithine deacetylase/succinyl-diaminopimelate desuccinylase-like protein